jgi:ribosomal-protein-alanine N-acetyltransferase
VSPGRRSIDGPPTLETDRLLLRKVTLDDAKAVFAYASDPEVTRFVLWNAHRTHEDSTAFLQHTIRKYETGGEPEWGIVYKGDQRFIDTCGFASWEAARARAELGYVISKEYWGPGASRPRPCGP